MDWPTWEPTYRAILADFGFDGKADDLARDELDDLLATRLRATLPDWRGQEVTILGPAPTAHRPSPTAPLLVADPRVPPPRRPDLVVTDLDGDVALQLALSAMGVPLAVHAHGDNRRALATHVPNMLGPLLGTTQAAPSARVACHGGFTDGDRACCLAVDAGASSLTLVGFDLEHPAAKPGRDPQVKARKLAWARRIIDGLGVSVRFVS